MKSTRLRLYLGGVLLSIKKGTRVRIFDVNFALSAKWLLATTCLISVAQGSATNAMEFHRNGNKIYASGSFGLGDDIKLQRMLDAATKAGIVIDTVVFRVSPGGIAIAGKQMGNLIRERRLNTAFQGGCFSACTASFIGGVGRHDTVDNLPLFHPSFERTVFGIHGSSSNNDDKYFYDVTEPIVSADQSDILKHYRSLLNQEIPVEAMDRIDYAIEHLKDSQGFLRYFANDPTKTTTFCPSGDEAAADCIAYPGVTIRSDGIVNAGKLDLSDDYLWVRNVVNGNINPNFRRFPINLETDEAPPLENAYGVIRVADGGVWHMTEQTGADIIAAERGGTIIVEPGTNAPAQLIQEDIKVKAGDYTFDVPTFWVASPRGAIVTAVDGGKIDLRGGTLVSDMMTTIRHGGTLSGHGAIASNLSVGAGSIFIPNGIRVQPFELLYQQDRASPSRVTVDGQNVQLTLGKDSNTIFNISAEDTEAKIRLVAAETIVPTRGSRVIIIYSDFVRQHHRGRLVIAPGAVATLNVNRGFFKAGKRLTLVDVERVDGSAYGRPDTPDFRPNSRGWPIAPKLGRKPIVEGAFATVRRDANDAGIAFSDGAIFHPRENSLLSFTIHEVKQEQEVTDILIAPETSVWRITVPEKRDVKSVTTVYPEIYMTANRAFDDVALFGNRRSSNALGSVLRDASDQDRTGLAPLLATLQFANRDVARREAGSLRGDGHASLRLASANFARVFASTVRNQVASLRRLDNDVPTVADRASVSSDQPDERGARFWITGFGQTGRIASDGAVDRLDQDSLGTLFGVSRKVGDNLDIGGGFGYGRLDARERPGSGIDARVNALGGSFYGDFRYDSGYILAQGGYLRLNTRASRSIIGIEGLEAANRSKYSSNAIVAGIEHGFTFNPNSPTRLTAIVPTLDYVRLSGVDFGETGSVAALVGQGRAQKSMRLGAGLEVSANIATAKGQRFAPYARVMYKRELLDGGREFAFGHGFALAPKMRFDAISRQLGRDIIEWGTGISSPANQAVTVSLDYSAQAARGYQNHNIKIGFDIRF